MVKVVINGDCELEGSSISELVKKTKRSLAEIKASYDGKKRAIDIEVGKVLQVCRRVEFPRKLKEIWTWGGKVLINPSSGQYLYPEEVRELENQLKTTTSRLEALSFVQGVVDDIRRAGYSVREITVARDSQNWIVTVLSLDRIVG